MMELPESGGDHEAGCTFVGSLKVLRGTTAGQVISLDGDKLVLGRGEECHIVIPNEQVGGAHAQIVRVEGRYFIEDLQSLNPTYLNDEAVNGRTPLNDDDRIKIWDFVCGFHECPPESLPQHERVRRVDRWKVEESIRQLADHERVAVEQIRKVAGTDSIQARDVLNRVNAAILELRERVERTLGLGKIERTDERQRQLKRHINLAKKGLLPVMSTSRTMQQLILHLHANPQNTDVWDVFEYLYRPFLVSLLRKKQVQESDIDDLVQRTLLEVMSEMPTFIYDPARGGFRRWIGKVLAYRLRGYRRDDKRERKRRANDPLAIEGVPAKKKDPSEETDDRLEKITSFIESKSGSRDAAIFQQRFLEGRKSEEIAASLGITTNAVYLAVSRFKKLLREEMEEE